YLLLAGCRLCHVYLSSVTRPCSSGSCGLCWGSPARLVRRRHAERESRAYSQCPQRHQHHRRGPRHRDCLSGLTGNVAPWIKDVLDMTRNTPWFWPLVATIVFFSSVLPSPTPAQ